MTFTWLAHLRSDDVSVLETTCRNVPQTAVQYLPPTPFARLHLVRSGSYRARNSHLEVLVDPVTALFVTSDTAIETTHPSGYDSEVNVRLSLDVLSAIGGGSVDLPSEAPLTSRDVLACERATSQLRRGNEDPFLMEELAISLAARCLASVEPGRVETSRPAVRRHRDLFDDARAALVADMHRCSVVELSRLVSCSPHHLSRIFKSFTGHGISRYRTNLRVRQALTRIAEGENDLAKLAHECGFADHAHLTRTFRRHLGETPSAARLLLSMQAPQGPLNVDQI